MYSIHTRHPPDIKDVIVLTAEKPPTILVEFEKDIGAPTSTGQ